MNSKATTIPIYHIKLEFIAETNRYLVIESTLGCCISTDFKLHNSEAPELFFFPKKFHDN